MILSFVCPIIRWAYIDTHIYKTLSLSLSLSHTHTHTHIYIHIYIYIYLYIYIDQFILIDISLCFFTSIPSLSFSHALFLTYSLLHSLSPLSTLLSVFLSIYIYMSVTAINRLSTIWKSDLTDKMKRSFFQAAVTSILLYGCTTWTLTKRLEKKLDGNYTRMLRAILNKSWQQHPTRHQLYGHLPPITKSIQVRRTRHAGHCWRSRDELIRDVLLWIPTHGRAKAGRPARTYIQQLCEDTGCCPEDLPRAMNDREEWRERVRDIRAASTIWWWWYIYVYIYMYVYISLSINVNIEISILGFGFQFWNKQIFTGWNGSPHAGKLARTQSIKVLQLVIYWGFLRLTHRLHTVWRVSQRSSVYIMSKLISAYLGWSKLPCRRSLNTPTACSEEEVRPLQKYVLDMNAKLHPVVRLWFKSFAECRVPNHCQIHSNPER